MTTLSLDVLYNDRGAERGMRNLGQTTERTSGRFKGLKVAGVAALAAVGVAAVKFGGDSVRAYVAAEGSQIRLQDAFRKFPKLADTNIGSLRKLNTELARKTKFDDDATASGQAVLAQFGLTGKQLTQLTPLLQDYAAKTGKDLPTAARDLGKAVLGQGRALKNVGINFKDTGSAGGNLDAIMKGLRTQVGGFAEKEGKSAAGQSAILKNQWGELQETAGQKLLPALLKVGGGLLKTVTAVQDGTGVFGSFKRIVSATFGAFSDALGGGRVSFRDFADFLQTNQANITRGFVVAAKIVIAFGGAFATLASTAMRAYASLMDGQADMIEITIGGFRKILQGANIAFGWIPGIGEKLKTADAKFASFSETAVGGLRRAATGGRVAADAIDNKLRPALDAAGKKLDEVSRKEIVKAEARDAVNKAAFAIRDLGTRADGSQVKLKTFAGISKLSAVEQRGLRGRINEARVALAEQLTAVNKAGGGQKQLTATWEKGRTALYKEFVQMGLSKREAQKLAEKYAGIKPKVETKVTQPGMHGRTGALQSFDRLDTKINDLNGKNLAINFTTNAQAAARKLGISVKNYNKDFDTGGYTGNLPPWVPAGVVHGDEQVIPSRSRRRFERKYPGYLQHITEHGDIPGYEAGGTVRTNLGALPRGLRHFPPDVANAMLRASVGWGRGAQDALLNKLNAASGGVGSVANPHGYARFHGGLFTKLAAANLRRAEQIAGMTMRVMQGGWRPRTSYSGTSHAGDAVDTQASGAVIRALRAVGWASGDRTGLGNWASHAHSVPGPGRGYAGGSAVWQYQDYLRRGGARQGLRSPWGLDKGGLLTAQVAEKGPERLLSAHDTRSYDRMVSLASRNGVGGTTTIININVPNGFVGNHQQLRQTLVDMNRSGQLAVIKR